MFDEGVLESAYQETRAFPPTGAGKRISVHELLELRRALVSAAESHTARASDAAFDLAVGRELERAGRASRGEFGDPRVWDFLTLVLVPDLAARRLRSTDGRSSESSASVKRITGGDRRHIFQKLWKRWCVFGADIVESGRLTEDDYVAMLERRITLERSGLARRVAGTITNSGFAGGSRREYTRVLMRRLQQASGLVHIRDDDVDYIERLVDHVHEQTVASLS